MIIEHFIYFQKIDGVERVKRNAPVLTEAEMEEISPVVMEILQVWHMIH